MRKTLAGAMALAAAVLSGQAAGAVTRTFDLVGVVTATDRVDPGAPDFNGTVGRGSISFDSHLITGIGNEVIGRGGLEIDFRIFGQHFTEDSDTVGRPFPALLLRDGNPRALDFFVREAGGNPVPIGERFLAGFFFDRLAPLEPAGDGAFTGRITALSAVPLPAALPLALAGALVLALLRRRRRGPA
jgi:hypothetical protein